MPFNYFWNYGMKHFVGTFRWAQTSYFWRVAWWWWKTWLDSITKFFVKSNIDERGPNPWWKKSVHCMYIFSVFFRMQQHHSGTNIWKISAKNSSNQQIKVKFDETLHYLHQRLKLTFFWSYLLIQNGHAGV